jgi:anti-sigma factor RsiW
VQQSTPPAGEAGMTAHLGASITAFVDGELDLERREHVLVHLAHCGSCRAEVAGLRGLKGALRREPAAPEDLAARLLASTTAIPVAAPVAVAPRRHVRLRRAAVGSACFAVGVVGTIRLAGPPVEPEVPVDPTGPGLVVEHVSTANEMPFVGADVTGTRAR